MPDIRIAVDAMGGDDAPQVVLDGCEAALLEDSDLEIVLVGPERIVVPFAEAHSRCEACPAEQVIEMGEHPAKAVRRKKDSSLVVASRLMKAGEVDGLFSAGSTGAVLASATLVAGRLRGVARPMLATVVPAPAGPVLLCDIGANADCKPAYLRQFAQMGTVYAQRVLGVEAPRIGLLNIGEEETKGSQFAQEAHACLADLPGFAGNAEGRDIFAGSFDVIVTDGFTGNVVLKTIEGTAKFLLKEMKAAMTSSLKNKLAAAVLQNDVRALASKLDADTYGGAPLLGVNGACLVGHGSSNARAVRNGIAFTAQTARNGVPGLIAQAIADADADADAAAAADRADGADAAKSRPEQVG